ncbi:hypothetical protein Pla123a_45110 [Posidoniimonas polymericola]|uniref:3-keto-alpha-glucoside-1,2-lyase/3-keto-2-hydroxy-glucal hydratase domain-containing protein n=1 Tax=Posidoniimonas polymericola TaxID=2528002 RepID=A0A5C5XWV4_9BACT|nr:DUF1080 domain-containing protein [Posidoniimonas polymericola]TWT66813.1 hypothetical protein Pla123a_45110 [Posidoniimonas polymericola]
MPGTGCLGRRGARPPWLAWWTAALLAAALPGVGQAADDGFQQLFDGKTLTDWQGDAPYWSVRDGAILGQITPETRITKNRFLVYQGELPADFELVAEYRISPQGNSGVNYRSEPVDGVDFVALAGYQCDIDGPLNYTGSNYEERRRTTLARVGESVVVPPSDAAAEPGRVDANAWTLREVTPLPHSADELRDNIRRDDWNEVRIVAHGNRLEHYLNGVLTSRVEDNDLENRRLDGRLGVQVHVGPPMTVEYRVIKVRPLHGDSDPPQAETSNEGRRTK